MHQILYLRMTTKKITVKENLVEAFDTIDTVMMWELIEVYEVGRKLLDEVEAFCRDTIAYLMNRELGHHDYKAAERTKNPLD